MAKDTEKLIRQLSLISYLMAERRPVSAPEIRRDVEGYSVMNEDAFARRFYADRSELESLGIVLSVEHPQEGQSEQETYALPPENFHLPVIEFSDEELAALWTALDLLDGRFAYAEPLRLALEQITWGHPGRLDSPLQHSVQLGITGEVNGHELSQRLAKVETAIFRRKTITFDYYTIDRDEISSRRVDPYQLLFRDNQFYLVGRSHEREAIRVFRLSRIVGKVGYATKSEHDFQHPADFDPHAYANREQWQFGQAVGTAEIWLSDRIAWLIKRHDGRFGELHDAGERGGAVFVTDYADPRALISWVLTFGEHAQILAPSELVAELHRRVRLVIERHSCDLGEFTDGAVAAASADVTAAPSQLTAEPAGGGSGRVAAADADAAIRPERFARLVTLASILLDAGRRHETLVAKDLLGTLKISLQELRDDIDVLNVVNFGAGTYVLYAEITPEGTVQVEPEPYGDVFARPARLLPVEAKALLAAIDLIAEQLPAGALASVRSKLTAALGNDPARDGLQVAPLGGDDAEIAACVEQAITEHHLLELEYYKQNEDEFSRRRVEPYRLVNGVEGWYVVSFDPARGALRHFRLDRIKSVQAVAETFTPRPDLDLSEGVAGWLRTGDVPASNRARIWISPERARWMREQRTVVAEGRGGAVIVELSYAGSDWLVSNVLKEAGDAVILEPAAAREAVATAAARIDAAVPA
jgi:predicted DNA-binding transcriptional regulator YafY